MKISKRGFFEEDKRWFSEKEILRLKKAQEEILYLINRDYKISQVVTFVGDRYQFSLRQRDALKRATATNEKQILRKSKEITVGDIENQVVYIDGFNLIILLEIALSKGTLIYCNDGNIRDLAGLRGSYKLIDKTDIVIELIGIFLEEARIKKAEIYLDAPVSNSGNLKNKISEYSKNWSFKTEISLVNNADIVLEKLDKVISSDSIIIDKCESYFNLGKNIIKKYIKEAKIIDLGNKWEV